MRFDGATVRLLTCAISAERKLDTWISLSTVRKMLILAHAAPSTATAPVACSTAAL